MCVNICNVTLDMWENSNVIFKLSEMYWIRKLTIKTQLFTLLHTFRRLTPSHLHTHPTPLSDAFSHPFTHKLPPPSCPSLLSLPVDTPNKATCVVSGCLGERSPCKPAGHVYQGTVSTPALCAALFSFPTPSHFHPLDLSSLPSILLCSSDPSYSFLSTPFSAFLAYHCFFTCLFLLHSGYQSFHCQCPCQLAWQQTRYIPRHSLSISLVAHIIYFQNKISRYS